MTVVHLLSSCHPIICVPLLACQSNRPGQTRRHGGSLALCPVVLLHPGIMLLVAQDRQANVLAAATALASRRPFDLWVSQCGVLASPQHVCMCAKQAVRLCRLCTVLFVSTV